MTKELPHPSKKLLSVEQIRMAMAALKWSNQQLADKSGVGVATVARVLSGQVTENTSRKLKDAFDQNGIEFIEDGDDSRFGGEGVRFSLFDFDPSPVDYYIHRFGYCISKNPHKTDLPLMMVLNILNDLECVPISETLEVFDMLPVNIEPILDQEGYALEEDEGPTSVLDRWEKFNSLIREIGVAISTIRFQQNREFTLADLRDIRNKLAHGTTLYYGDDQP